MKQTFNDFWSRSGRIYRPACATDIRLTFERIQRERDLEAGKDPLNPEISKKRSKK